MPLPPDPDPSISADRQLWAGLTVCLAAILLLAFTVQQFLPADPPSQGALQGTGRINLKGTPPLMTRPQRLENQQAMPELADFDAQNPPPQLSEGSGPIRAPGPPSPPGSMGLGQ
jgi:hypothetical protein